MNLVETNFVEKYLGKVKYKIITNDFEKIKISKCEIIEKRKEQTRKRFLDINIDDLSNENKKMRFKN